jgi:predicted RNase H-like HicB family nuclease
MRLKKLDIHIEYFGPEEGFLAKVAQLPGCVTCGDTLAETLEMVNDAIELYIATLEDMEKESK